MELAVITGERSNFRILLGSYIFEAAVLRMLLVRPPVRANFHAFLLVSRFFRWDRWIWDESHVTKIGLGLTFSA